ncbi:unnamed protein product [Mytilus coruscus]|uniref:Uncharacterized protein n=1 Tax=Mytilus coruscus TaxID=42192 RepID=A0A6J8BJR0_MYTCO|nr:unnamed protein product [Mytilus coruscus]
MDTMNTSIRHPLDDIKAIMEVTTKKSLLAASLPFGIPADNNSSKSLSYNSSCWRIMGSVLGGSLLFSIFLNINCFLKRKKNSGIISNIQHEVQYDEIGNISFTSANDQFVPNNAQELVTSLDSPVFEGDNNFSSLEKSSSSDSSVHSLSISLLNEDGYENPYQTIEPGNVEMHPYSTIWSNLYQNTTVFPNNKMNKYVKNEIHGL